MMIELEELPDAEKYKLALIAIEPRMTANQRSMLIAHFRASEHSATMRGLAASVGCDKFQVANAQYGRLGTLLRNQLNYHGAGQKSYVIADLVAPGGERNEWVLRMHPPLSSALESLGW